MASPAIDYHGRPAPLEFEFDTPISELVQMANERFGLLPTYHTHIQFVPLEPGGKRPAKGFVPKLHPTTNTRASINLLVSDYQDSELGIGSRGAVGALTVVDNDHLVGGEDVRQRYERETGRRWPRTYVTQTRPQSAPWKTNDYFKTTTHSLATLKKQVTHLGEITGFDLKGNGGWGYVRAEGNVRNGERVTVLHAVPIVDMPDDLADWIAATNAKAHSQKRRLARKKPERAEPEATSPRPFAVARGDRNRAVKSRVRTYKNLGHSDEETFALVKRDIRECFEDGDDYLAKLKLRAIIRKVPTIGRHASLRNLLRDRRPRRKSPFHRMRERIETAPDRLTSAEARRLLDVHSHADELRMLRQLRRARYVLLGPQGSHHRIWMRLRPPASVPLSPSPSSFSLSPYRAEVAQAAGGTTPSESKSERFPARQVVARQGVAGGGLTLTFEKDGRSEKSAATHETEAA